MKISRKELMNIIKEELTAVQKQRLDTLKGKDQQTPDDEEEIKDLEHQ
tara:strand:- start:2996 stop:3139 length:144 start_codon:yes stop_codon:yes gene_type:complete